MLKKKLQKLRKIATPGKQSVLFFLLNVVFNVSRSQAPFILEQRKPGNEVGFRFRFMFQCDVSRSFLCL